MVVLAALAPWVVAIAALWRRSRRRDGWIPPSAADLVRARLWAR